MGGDHWGAPIQGEAETWTMATARRSGSRHSGSERWPNQGE